jgi:UDP-GlcNAc:undecaprenyl-phosphate GlcNAc-1-phosphate transferase
VIWVARHVGFVAKPREDRWHKEPTALLGGISLFFSFIVPYLFLGEAHSYLVVLAAGAGAMFLLGLVDDIFELSPQTKFIAQLIVSACVVAGGIRIQGLSHPVLTVILSVFWFVAITNALNILDNMDGLATGILCLPSILIAGATAGFWIYNFNPAKIFMGDCGSLFLGFTLAGLTVMGTWGMHPSTSYTGVTNLILVLVVPVGVLIIPLFDTALVSFTRAQVGRPISKGGRDHTSHRLVLLGYSEPRTVLTLTAWAGVISALVLYLSQYSTQGLVVVLAVVAVISLFFGIFLTHLNSTVYEGKVTETARTPARNSLLSTMLNKKQILQAAVDTVLITAAYVTSYLLRYEGIIAEMNLRLIERSLPLLLPVKLCCFWIFGLYRGQWRYVSIGDMWQLLKAIVTSSLIIVGMLLYFYRFEGYSRVVFVNDALLSLIFIGGVRLLMRVFKEHFSQQAERKNSTPILIVGAGDGGDLFLRELRRNSHHDYMPIGFIDDDPAKRGQIIHGVKVIGARDDLPEIMKRHGIQRVFVAIMSATDSQIDGILQICARSGVPCEKVRPLLPSRPTGAAESVSSTVAGTGKVVPLTLRSGRKNER